MKLHRILALACIVLCPPVLGQATFDGKWKVTWDNPRPQEATLALSGAGGTWQTYSKSSNNPCIGREVPVTVLAATADEIKVRLEFAKTIPGCSDVSVELKRVDDTTLKGKRSQFEASAVRQ